MRNESFLTINDALKIANVKKEISTAKSTKRRPTGFISPVCGTKCNITRRRRKSKRIYNGDRKKRKGKTRTKWRERKIIKVDRTLNDILEMENLLTYSITVEII